MYKSTYNQIHIHANNSPIFTAWIINLILGLFLRKRRVLAWSMPAEGCHKLFTQCENNNKGTLYPHTSKGNFNTKNDSQR